MTRVVEGPVKEAELDYLERMHVIEEPEYHISNRHCDACWEDWPCAISRLVPALRAARAEVIAERDAEHVAALREVMWAVAAHVQVRAKGDDRLYVVHLHERTIAKIEALLALLPPTEPK